MQTITEVLIDVLKELCIVLLVSLGVTTGGLTASATATTTPTTMEAPAPGVLYQVVKVVDGDTITVDVEGKKQTVRLLGINTPETVDPRKPVECFGKEASEKMKSVLTNRAVRLEIDMSQGAFDKYDRLLGYVYRDDDLFVNKYMLEQGYAHEYTYNVPYEYQKEFKYAQSLAQDRRVGLWESGVCE